MLPLRISVQGFMSYRDHTVFDFEGARLWMLAGANGTGKSTVFDALRWALFGVHRGGKQKPEQLIHHEADRLAVEVELQLNDGIYKLKRTLGRESARPTWDVARRVGAAWESVSGTGMAREYERWIERNIGLTDEAFCASVYLSQGHADAILNADAEARYALLSQLVDLEVYEHWHARADERRAQTRLEMADARKRWETAPAPEPERIAELREQREHLEQEVLELQTRARDLDGARADASRWEDWSAKVSQLKTLAATQHALLADEVLIERNFARLEHLKTHRVEIESFYHTLNKHDELSQKLEVLTPQSEQAKRVWKEAQTLYTEAQAALEGAQNAWTSASEKWSGLVNEVALLASQRATIERWGQLLARRSAQEKRLADFERDLNVRLEEISTEQFTTGTIHADTEFERDLDTHLKDAERERDRAREAARNLPLWRRFDTARAAFALAQTSRDEWAARQSEAFELHNALQIRLMEARATLQSARAHLRGTEEKLTTVREQMRALVVRQTNFAKVEGEATCHFCGQELSSEHRVAEVERLKNAAREIEREKEMAQNAFDTARLHSESARLGEEEVALLFALAERDIAGAALELRHQSDNAQRERAAARAAWDELGLGNAEHFEMAFVIGRRPYETDFGHMEKLTTRVPALEARLSELGKKANERDTLTEELARLNEELAPLLSEWDDAQVEQWMAHAVKIEHSQREAKIHFDQTQSAVENARTLQAETGKHERTARTEMETLSQQIGPLEGQLLAASGALHLATPAFRAAWGHEDEPLPTSDVMRSLRAQWQRETEQLERSNVTALHAALVEARSKLTDIERDCTFYSREIETLPPLARQPRAGVETQWKEATTQLSHCEELRERAGDDLRRLEREQKERAALEALLQERSLQHDRWAELARLLGPHQLQRHLLRAAESAIVREANGVLESISGGTLRLELVPDSDEHTGNRPPKVLDVVCFHLSGGEATRPIAPAFLSGSQRFRVAVALALGIGRTATRGTVNSHNTRAETILIDEGFGALDKTGRDEMKDELRELGRELGRVILVSHQEDFANAFPNRFNITLENGVSRVEKVVE